MQWTQAFVAEDIELDEFKSIIDSLDTDGTFKSVSVELVADAPINVATQETTAITNDGPSTTVDEPDETTTDSTEHESEAKTVEQPLTDGIGAVRSTEETTASEPSGVTPSQVDVTPIGEAEPLADASESDTTEPESDSEPTTESGLTLRQIAEEETDSEPEDSLPDVSPRKWPKLDHELGLDYDLPLSAAAYPDEPIEFSGTEKSDTEFDTVYEANVNGTVDFGVFVTLNGSGYNPRSKYTDVTGLIHSSNLLHGTPISYSPGDRVVVKLDEEYTTLGDPFEDDELSFFQLPRLSVEQAKEARHIETLRLQKLDIEAGDTLRFGKWPDNLERKGTVRNIDTGSDDPIRPPTLTIQTDDDVFEIRPSEVIAGSVETPETATTDVTDTADTTEATDSEPNNSVDSPLSVMSLPMTASPYLDYPVEDPAPDEDSGPDTADSEATEAVDSDDPDTDDEELTCACGRSFDNERQMWGHQGHCDDYKAAKEETGDDATAEDDTGTETPAEVTAETSDNGRVINPVLLDVSNKYAKVAAAMHLSGDESYSVRELADLLADTEWEMPKANLNIHAKTLVDKGAAKRRKDGVYQYYLTDRGTAGVKQALDDMDASKIPTFE